MSFHERVFEQHATTLAVLILLAMAITAWATAPASRLSDVRTVVHGVHAEQSAAPRR